MSSTLDPVSESRSLPSGGNEIKGVRNGADNLKLSNGRRSLTPYDQSNISRFLKWTTGSEDKAKLSDIYLALMEGSQHTVKLDSSYIPGVARAERSEATLYWDNGFVAVIVNGAKPVLLPQKTLSESERKKYEKTAGNYGGQILPEQREEAMQIRLEKYLRHRGFKVEGKLAVDLKVMGGPLTQRIYPDLRVGRFNSESKVLLELKADNRIHSVMTASGQAGLAAHVLGHPVAICVPDGQMARIPDEFKSYCKKHGMDVIEESGVCDWATKELDAQDFAKFGKRPVLSPIKERFWVTTYSETLSCDPSGSDDAITSPVLTKAVEEIAKRVGLLDKEVPTSYAALIQVFGDKHRLPPERVEEELLKRLEMVCETIFSRNLLKVAAGKSDARKFALKSQNWIEVDGDHLHVERWTHTDACRAGFGIVTALKSRGEKPDPEKLFFTVHIGSENRHSVQSLASMLNGETEGVRRESFKEKDACRPLLADPGTALGATTVDKEMRKSDMTPAAEPKAWPGNRSKGGKK